MAIPVDDPSPTKGAADSPGTDAAAGGDGFSFPADKGGELLAGLLPPSGKWAPARDLAGPRELAPPAAMERPQVSLTPCQSPLLQAPLNPPRRTPNPWLLPEEPPLSSQLGSATLPRQEPLPAAAGVRLPSSDVEQPVPLSIQGLLSPDRAALDDPTADFSLQAAVSAAIPERSMPAPFVRFNLPDPFENSQTVRLRSVPLDEEGPSPYSPRLPKKP